MPLHFKSGKRSEQTWEGKDEGKLTHIPGGLWEVWRKQSRTTELPTVPRKGQEVRGGVRCCVALVAAGSSQATPYLLRAWIPCGAGSHNCLFEVILETEELG